MTIINSKGGRDIVHGRRGDDILSGGANGDFLFGGPGADTLNGNAGHDKLFGGSGPDTLDGGAGNDRLKGDAGADVLNGGDGDDVIFARSDKAIDTIDCGPGDDVAYVDATDVVVPGTCETWWPRATSRTSSRSPRAPTGRRLPPTPHRAARWGVGVPGARRAPVTRMPAAAMGYPRPVPHGPAP